MDSVLMFIPTITAVLQGRLQHCNIAPAASPIAVAAYPSSVAPDDWNLQCALD